MRGVWRDAELVDPNTHNNKLATYHSWFAIPNSRNERMPINVPRYLHLDLSKHDMRNIISRFRLRAHTLNVEALQAAVWLEGRSRVCDQRPGEDEYVQNEVHALLICQDHRVCELRKHFLAKPQSWGAALGLMSSHQSSHQCAQARPAHPPPPEFAQ